jgi:hypothetical protein
VVSTAKNPVKQRAGAIGARARWGEPRIVRLDGLGAEERAIVLAYAELGRKRLERAVEPPGSGQS